MPVTNFLFQLHVSNAWARFLRRKHKHEFRSCSLNKGGQVCQELSRTQKVFLSFCRLFPTLSLAFSDNNFPRTFHMQTFIFFSLGIRRNFPHEKHFPSDQFSLRFHLHDSRRVFGFVKKIIKLWKNNRKINFLKPREEARQKDLINWHT